MVAERKYMCNLCRDTLLELGAPDAPYKKRGVGVLFLAGGKLKFTFLRDVEHHICDNCIAGIIENHETTKKVDAARSE